VLGTFEWYRCCTSAGVLPPRNCAQWFFFDSNQTSHPSRESTRPLKDTATKRTMLAAALRACLATAILASASCWTPRANAVGRYQGPAPLRTALAQRTPRLAGLRCASMVASQSARREAAAPTLLPSTPSAVEDEVSDAIAARSCAHAPALTPLITHNADRLNSERVPQSEFFASAKRERGVCLLKGIAEGTYKTKHAEAARLCNRGSEQGEARIYHEAVAGGQGGPLTCDAKGREQRKGLRTAKRAASARQSALLYANPYSDIYTSPWVSALSALLCIHFVRVEAPPAPLLWPSPRSCALCSRR